jgi:glycosyltransferase 2 family protein
MKNILIAAFKIVITIVLFYLLFRKVDLNEFAAVLRNARLDYLTGAFVMIWLAHYICIFRWRMLMRPLMPVLSLARLMGIYCIGLFFNLAFPTVVGGDVVKMYYAGKPSRLYAQSFAATFLDRDAGMLAMMMIACGGFLAHPLEVPGIPVGLFVWGGTSLFVLGNVALFTPFLHRFFSRLLQRCGLSRVAAKIDAISDAFQIMARHRLVLFGSLLISLTNQLFVIAVTWGMAEGLHLGVPLPYFLVFVPVVTLISMVPVSLNGMGLREYAFVTLLSGIGVDREGSVALGLLSSAMLIVSAVPGGIIYMVLKDKAGLQEMAAMETDFR